MWPTPAGDGTGDLGRQLVVAVQGDQRRIHPGGQRDLELAAGADVNAEALSVTQRSTAREQNAFAA